MSDKLSYEAERDELRAENERYKELYGAAMDACPNNEC